MDEFNEGFQQVNTIFSKLGESRGMPWQQVRDQYNRQYSRSNAQNLWNIYSAYFAKNTQTELARLPSNQEVQAPPSVDVRKQCYERFKDQHPDKYVDFLETWKEAKELADVGATVAQRQQLFLKSARNLDHLVSISYIRFVICIERLCFSFLVYQKHMGLKVLISWPVRSSTKMVALAMLSPHQVLMGYVVVVQCALIANTHFSSSFLGVAQIPMRSSVISRHIYSE